MAAISQWREFPSNAVSQSRAFASDVTAGQLILVGVRDSGGGGTSLTDVSDSLSSAYELMAQIASDAGTLNVYGAIAPSSGPCTVAIAGGSGVANRAVMAACSGNWGGEVPSLTDYSTADGVATLISTGAIAGTVDDETPALFVAFCGNATDTNFTEAGSGWALGPVGSSRIAIAARSGAAEESHAAVFAWDSGAAATAALAMLLVESAGAPSLSIDEQPTATQSGYLIDPAPVVHVLDAEGALDTSFTGDVTASLLDSGGVLLGTLTVAAVAGVATFSALRPCEAGTYQLRFAASGYANLDSSVFTVTAGEGSTNVIVHQEAPMRPIRRNEPTAALRDIPITILADDGAPWDGDPDAGGGLKAQLSQNFGAETPSPANIVKLSAGNFRVRPTDAYTDIVEGSIIKARVPAAAGRREGIGWAHIIPADTYVSADAARKALVDAVIIASDGGNGYEVVKQPESNQIQRTIPGVGVVTITAVFSPSVPGIVSAGGS